MSSENAVGTETATALLARRLAELTPDQLAELVRARGLHRTHGYRLPRSLEDLARLLFLDASVVLAGVATLDTPELEALSAASWLVLRRHGRPAAETSWSAGDGGERAVPRAAVLDLLAPEGCCPSGRCDPREAGACARCRADAVLRRLGVLALVVEEGPVLSVPPVAVLRLPAGLGLGRGAERLLDLGLDPGQLPVIAERLGEDPAGAEPRAAVLGVLCDAGRVRALAAEAPAEAAALLGELVQGPPSLRARCFRAMRPSGFHPTGPLRYEFRAEGSGEPGADWLAERGLVLPSGADTVELPCEVGMALRGPGPVAPFTSEAPSLAPAAVPVTAEAVRTEGRAAAVESAGRLERLLSAVDAQPPALRRSGGLAVRDTRRLAKAAGLTERQAQLWLDLCHSAGLLAVDAREADTAKSPAALLPTERYDDWVESAPAERLLPMLAAWAVIPAVLGRPEEEDGEGRPRSALCVEPDGVAVDLRRAVLRALGGLPEGSGLGPDGAEVRDEEPLHRLARLVSWQRPLLHPMPSTATFSRVSATVREAELLGVVARGALTPVGRALLELFEELVEAEESGEGAVEAAAERDSLRKALVEAVPAPESFARFQADLTAVVPGAPTADLAALLGAVADRESEGHAVVWRFSAASVRRALDAGWAGESVVAELSAVSARGAALPQPLEYLVRDTARTHGRMRVVRSACCVRSDDEALVEELARSPRLGLRRIAPTVLVSTRSEEETLAALRSAGYAPVLEAETGATVIERGARRRASLRLPRARCGERATPRAVASRLLADA